MAMRACVTDLCIGIILRLQLPPHICKLLVRINQRIPHIADNTRTTRMHKRLTAHPLRLLHQQPRPLHIDFAHNLLCALRHCFVAADVKGRADGVDDDIGADRLEGGAQGGHIGDVGGVVGGRGEGGLADADVEDVDTCRGLGVALEEEGDDVAAEEAATTCHKDGA